MALLDKEPGQEDTDEPGSPHDKNVLGVRSCRDLNPDPPRLP
jgi:hypothetical protein